MRSGYIKDPARAVAMKNGDKTYIPTVLCIRGHTGPRRTSDRSCLECNKDKQKVRRRAYGMIPRALYTSDPTEISLRNQAKALGHKTYKTSVPCPRGHTTRYVSSRAVCVTCTKLVGIRSLYGLSVEDFYEMLDKQRHRCAICNCKICDRTLHVDHCHATGKIRGLLCPRCNTGLGHMRDNPAYLAAAIRYLEVNRGTT